MKNYEIQIIIGANLSYLDSSEISSIFRLVAEYDLFKPKNFIQNLIYADFCKNFTQFFFQFLETGTSYRTRKGLDQVLSNLGFNLYPHSFFL